MYKALGIFAAIFPFYLSAQALYTTGGAQCGTHGNGGCEHFQTPCPPEADASIHFILRTDNQGHETSWQLFDVTDNIVVESGQNLLSKITYDVLVCAYRDHCYRLTISDAGGNGIDPAEGGFTLLFNGALVAEGSVFTDMLVLELGACCNTLEVKLAGGFACYDAATGQVVASVSGGAPPYAYNWSTGATHATIVAVSPGDDAVSVEVTDAAGCSAADTLSIPAIGPFSAGAEATAPSVEGAADGLARAIPSGGIQPYTFSWSTGATTLETGGLAAGNYTVTVLDASGCSASTAVVVPEGPSSVRYNTQPLEGMAVFPNPTTGVVTIVFRVPESSHGTLQIADASGQLRHSQYFRAVVGENQLTLRVQTLPPGVYMVSVRAGNAAGSRWLVVAR